jgi:hypothetical protein
MIFVSFSVIELPEIIQQSQYPNKKALSLYKTTPRPAKVPSPQT